MKKIALLMDGWKRFITYAWPSGVTQRIRETGEEVNLYIFNSSGSWSYDTDYNMGEYNIYHLPDLTEFDGIILELNNVKYPEVCEQVYKAAKESGKPVISVANAVDDFYYAGIHNYRAMREMIEHLHRIHGCESFWMVMGPEDNYENSVRTRALKEYLQENHLPDEDERFYYGNYEYECGVSGFLCLLEQFGEIPDAIICANDNIALGVCESARSLGFEAPKDFKITGFDNFDKASYYSPRISTVGFVREEIGYLCADIFLRLWNGETVPHLNYIDTQSFFRESCGCRNEAGDVRKIFGKSQLLKRDIADYQQHTRDQIMYQIETEYFEEQILMLEYELMQCKDIHDLSECMKKYVPGMKCDAMYLLLDPCMYHYHEQTVFYDTQLLHQEGFGICGYPESMYMEFAYENGEMHIFREKQVNGIFPEFEYGEKGTDFLFVPLHFRQYTVGYFVIRNAAYLMEQQYVFKVANILSSAMENLHKKERMAYMNGVLSNLYIRDPMTNLYNRLGYQKLAMELFEKHKQSQENFYIMFVDMDRLKYINDHFGHEYGDWAIKTVSRALEAASPKDAILVRAGGDEFVMIMEAPDKVELDLLKERIYMEVKEHAVKMQLPFELTVSIGCVKTDMDSEKTLDDYIREADEIMYREKVNKQMSRQE